MIWGGQGGVRWLLAVRSAGFRLLACVFVSAAGAHCSFPLDEFRPGPVDDGGADPTEAGPDLPAHVRAAIERCSTEGDALGCFRCCGQAFEQGADTFNRSVGPCLCRPLVCSSPCFDSCAGATEPSASCARCTIDALGPDGACRRDAFVESTPHYYYARCAAVCPRS